MGMEYRIFCRPQGQAEVRDSLRRLGGQTSTELPDQFEFHFQPRGSNEMPDASVTIEAESIYFVDYGGERQQVALLLRRIIDDALTSSDSSDSIVITSL